MAYLGSKKNRNSRYDYNKGDGQLVSEFSRRAARCQLITFSPSELRQYCEGGEGTHIVGLGYELSTEKLSKTRYVRKKGAA